MNATLYIKWKPRTIWVNFFNEKIFVLFQIVFLHECLSSTCNCVTNNTYICPSLANRFPTVISYPYNRKQTCNTKAEDIAGLVQSGEFALAMQVNHIEPYGHMFEHVEHYYNLHVIRFMDMNGLDSKRKI